MLTKRKQCLAQRALRHEGSNEGKEFGMRKHGRSGDDSSMGGGGGCSNNHAPRATAAGNDELGGSERDGDGGDGGDVVRGGHGGVGTRLGGLGAADERGIGRRGQITSCLVSALRDGGAAPADHFFVRSSLRQITSSS